MQHISVYTNLLLLIRLGPLLVATQALGEEFSSHDALMNALEEHESTSLSHEKRAHALRIMRRVKRAPYAGCRCVNGQWVRCACDHPYTLDPCDFKISGQTLSAAGMVLHGYVLSDKILSTHLSNTHIPVPLLTCSIYGRLSWPWQI